MQTRGDDGVGRFSVEIEVVNDADLILAQGGHIPADQVRRETIPALVDSGATKLVLPAALVSAWACRWATRSTSVMPTADGPAARVWIGSTSSFWVVTGPSPRFASRSAKPP